MKVQNKLRNEGESYIVKVVTKYNLSVQINGVLK